MQQPTYEANTRGGGNVHTVVCEHDALDGGCDMFNTLNRRVFGEDVEHGKRTNMLRIRAPLECIADPPNISSNRCSCA